MPRTRSQRSRRPRRRKPQPLRVSLAERVGTIQLAQPGNTRSHPALMPSPPRSTRDVLALLMAATGLALAARRDAKVTLLPGRPTTVVLSASDQPAAAFVLPISEEDARRMFGHPAGEPRDRLLEQLFEEQRQAELAPPDVLLDQYRAYSWGLEDRHAC